MNNGSNRDDELEIIRQLLIATASRTESNDESINRLTPRMDQLTSRMDQLTSRMDQLTSRMDQLAIAQQNTQVSLDQLTALMVSFVEDGEADRAVIRRLQTENRQILEYLFGQQRNGNGEGPPQ